MLEDRLNAAFGRFRIKPPVHVIFQGKEVVVTHVCLGSTLTREVSYFYLDEGTDRADCCFLDEFIASSYFQDDDVKAVFEKWKNCHPLEAANPDSKVRVIND